MSRFFSLFVASAFLVLISLNTAQASAPATSVDYDFTTVESVSGQNVRYSAGDTIRDPRGRIVGYATGHQICTNWTHTITVKEGFTTAFKTMLWKSWCWTYTDLYNATFTGPFAMSYWYTLHNGWRIDSQTLSYNGWHVYGVSHRTTTITNAHICGLVGGFCRYKSQTNSFCGKNYGGYSYNNNCA